MQNTTAKHVIGVLAFAVALVFVYRSFYHMRIPEEDSEAAPGSTRA